MLYRTVAEYDEAIADLKGAIGRAMKGQSYSLTKGAVAVSRANYNLSELYKLLRLLQDEREALVGGLGNSGAFALARNVRRWHGR